MTGQRREGWKDGTEKNLGIYSILDIRFLTTSGDVY